VIRRLPLVIWLLAVWVGLWGNLSAANVASGLAVAVALVAVFPFPVPQTRTMTVRPLRALVFVMFFAWKLVQASAVVAWEVVTPRNRIREAIVAVPIHGVSDTLSTIVANLITLTPGTLTLELAHEPPVLYVHVLHTRSIEGVRRDVQRLERIVTRTFGSAAAQRMIEGGAPK